MTLWSRVKKELKRRGLHSCPSPRRAAYLTHKEEARKLITEEVVYFARRNNFSYQRIAIRDQRRSWGSCSAHGNLNFSYKLMFLPSCLRQYIIVHELCHLRELNHGQAFWNEIARIIPDYERRTIELKTHERKMGTSRPALQQLKQKHQEESCERCWDTTSASLMFLGADITSAKI